MTMTRLKETLRFTKSTMFLGLCKEVWVFGDVITEGMKREISVAKKRKSQLGISITI